MLRRLIFVLIVTFVGAAPSWAQQKGTWIQVEAKATEAEAMERISVYSAIMPEVGGFELTNGWFAVAIGPFSSLESEFLIAQFRRTGLIPPDSYISSPDQFVRQFYPPQEADQTQLADENPPKTTLPDLEAEAQIKEGAALAEETLSEARASESALTLEQKKELQTALKWAGFYTSTIDGLFGRGTRASMGNWQQAKGYDDTGVLTTRQRAHLLSEYYAVLNGLDMGPVTDAKAGITVDMPRAVVSFDGYTAPFAHYRSPNGSEAQVHLISRPGDRGTLYALFDVMEGLEIVPLEGYRKKNRNNIILTGQNDRILSHTEAYLDGGLIKGFTLVWPADRPEQAERIIERMAASFSTTSDVLARGEGLAIEQGQDSLAGLEVRTPKLVRSGLFINRDGYILTSADIGPVCSSIEVQNELRYTLVGHSEEMGLSVLAPLQPVSPRDFGRIRASGTQNGSKISVAGYPYGGMLGAPSLTHGTIAALTGLNGEEHLDRLSLSHFPTDAGGAVLGLGGEVVGVLAPRGDETVRSLPSDVSFMTDNQAIISFLKEANVAHALNLALVPKDPIEIERFARDIAIWIECWE